MSTKKESKTTNQYNQGSMNAFNALTPAVQKNWLNDMALDPRKAESFNLALQAGMQNNQLGAQRSVFNLTQNLKTGGFAGTNLSGVHFGQLAKIGRQKSAMDSNSLIQNWLNYDMLRRQTTSNAAGYKPLQIGQTNVEKTSGLGTWLPQVIGGGLALASAFATGGASAAGGAGAAGSKAAASGASQLAAGSAFSLGGNNPLMRQSSGLGWD
jgi:hypothetical protein